MGIGTVLAVSEIVENGMAPVPVGAAAEPGLRFRRRNQHLHGRLSHDRQIRQHREKEELIMRKHLVVLASMALLMSAGVASAQQQTPKQYDSSGAPQPQQNGTRTGPAATMPDASGAATSGQAPARSQMPAEKDSSGAPKPTPAPGDVRK